MKISKTQLDKATKHITSIYGFLYDVDDSLYAEQSGWEGHSKKMLLELCDEVIDEAKSLKELIDKHYIQDSIHDEEI